MPGFWRASLALALAILLTLVSASPVSVGILAGSDARASTQTMAVVTFSAPLSVERSAQLLQRAGATVVELRFEYSALSESRGGGFFVNPSGSPRQMASSFGDAVRAMISDQLAENGRLRAFLPDDGRLAAQGQGLAHALTSFPSNPIFEALISADASAIAALGSEPQVSRVTTLSAQRSAASPSSGRGPGLAARTSAHRQFSDWVPNTVYVTVTDSSFAGQRYVQQTFIWNSGRSLNFPTNSGFEAQFYINNIDGLTYLTNQQDWNGFPSGAIWDSNMPGKYLVTCAGDPDHKRCYMVGTWDAPLLTTGFWYNTYVRTPNGNTNYDGGEIQPQLTEETVGGCQSTWCMGAHQTCYTGYYPIQLPTTTYSWTWTGSNC